MTRDGWLVCCPAHEDTKPSLSVTDTANGRVLIHCHAGCTPEAVVKAAGLKMSDLMPEKRNGQHQPTGKIVATYDYPDADGKLLFQVVRFEPKDFRQRKPDATAVDGWRWNAAINLSSGSRLRASINAPPAPPGKSAP